MINEQIKANGELRIVLKDANGNVKEDKTVPNLVVTVGKTFIASRMVGTSSAVMSHMAIGSNAAAPIAANTALGAELGRVALTSGLNVTNVVTYVATFGSGVGTGAVVEAGILNAGSGGTLLCHTTFSVVNKAATDTLTISWSVTLS